jgi:hypothetical protein
LLDQELFVNFVATDTTNTIRHVSLEILNPKRKIEMQIVESYQPASSIHILTDEIYSPSLNTAAADALSNASIKAQQHLKAITELHRFLESSCDCV